jgi:hypothetical protein
LQARRSDLEVFLSQPREHVWRGMKQRNISSSRPEQKRYPRPINTTQLDQIQLNGKTSLLKLFNFGLHFTDALCGKRARERQGDTKLFRVNLVYSEQV